MTPLCDIVAAALRDRGHRLSRPPWVRRGWWIQAHRVDDGREAVAVLPDNMPWTRAQREDKLRGLCDELVHVGQVHLHGTHHLDAGLVCVVVVRRDEHHRGSTATTWQTLLHDLEETPPGTVGPPQPAPTTPSAAPA